MRNDVYTNLAQNINTQVRPVKFTQTYELVPDFLPCVYFRESHSVIAQDISLEGTPTEDSTVYIEVYAVQNGEPTSEDIALEIEALMPLYGYTEQRCEPIDNADPTIERVSMTFNRVISRGDVI